MACVRSEEPTDEQFAAAMTAIAGLTDGQRECLAMLCYQPLARDRQTSEASFPRVFDDLTAAKLIRFSTTSGGGGYYVAERAAQHALWHWFFQRVFPAGAPVANDNLGQGV